MPYIINLNLDQNMYEYLRLKGLKKRKNRQAIKLQKKQDIHDFCIKVNRSNHRSDVWIMNELTTYFTKKSMLNELKELKFNSVFKNTYIPDVISNKHCYIIESDGSIHNRDDIKIKDHNKDKFYIRSGFKIFRVVAYDNNSLMRLFDNLDAIYKRKVIIRSAKS